MKYTPTEKAIHKLISLGYKHTASGGSGYIMPRYWIFKKPDGETFIACKTKSLKEEIAKAEGK